MKKRDGKVKMNNKGFSLVELIVVIAIMAVLVGVLAPQYLRYVEKARLQKDNSAIAEIANAIKIAMADETINDATANGDSISTTSASAVANTTKEIKFDTDKALEKELNYTIGDSWKTTSNTYKKEATEIVFVVIKSSDGVISVRVDGYRATPDASPSEDTDGKRQFF